LHVAHFIDEFVRAAGFPTQTFVQREARELRGSLRTRARAFTIEVWRTTKGNRRMALSGIVVGTGLRNDDGSSRARVIRRRCEPGCDVFLRKVAVNPGTSASVAVYLGVPRLFGLLRSSFAQIGYLDAEAAASVLGRIDSSGEVRARVKSVYAPQEKDNPRVSLTID
jgi:hypothetical protein